MFGRRHGGDGVLHEKATGSMTATVPHPPKEQVRAYLARRARDPQPPPAPEEIRRQLGWGVRQCLSLEPAAGSA
jgi:hypothetical protein